MGKIDNVTNKFVSDARVFADAFNFYMYGGKQVLSPDNLTEQDTILTDLLPDGTDIKRYRDVIKSACIMEADGTSYVLLAIENQANIHYAMPVRNLLYDSLQYSQQIQNIARKNMEKKCYENSAEFLSGFCKNDRIAPVITLVIYFGAEEWDGPRNLSEMFYEGSEKYKDFLPEYKLNLITPSEISDEKFNLFNSPLKEVLAFIKYSKDKKALSELLKTHPSYKNIGHLEAELLKCCIGLDINTEGKSEEIDMCKAFEDMKLEGYEEGIHQTRLNDIRKIMNSLNYSAIQAMNLLEIPDSDRDAMLSELG